MDEYEAIMEPDEEAHDMMEKGETSKEKIDDDEEKKKRRKKMWATALAVTAVVGLGAKIALGGDDNDDEAGGDTIDHIDFNGTDQATNANPPTTTQAPPISAEQAAQ